MYPENIYPELYNGGGIVLVDETRCRYFEQVSSNETIKPICNPKIPGMVLSLAIATPQPPP